jgi:hypothetical protein
MFGKLFGTKASSPAAPVLTGSLPRRPAIEISSSANVPKHSVLQKGTPLNYEFIKNRLNLAKSAREMIECLNILNILVNQSTSLFQKKPIQEKAWKLLALHKQILRLIQKNIQGLNLIMINPNLLRPIKAIWTEDGLKDIQRRCDRFFAILFPATISPGLPSSSNFLHSGSFGSSPMMMKVLFLKYKAI